MFSRPEELHRDGLGTERPGSTSALRHPGARRRGRTTPLKEENPREQEVQHGNEHAGGTENAAVLSEDRLDPVHGRGCYRRAAAIVLQQQNQTHHEAGKSGKEIPDNRDVIRAHRQKLQKAHDEGHNAEAQAIVKEMKELDQKKRELDAKLNETLAAANAEYKTLLDEVKAIQTQIAELKQAEADKRKKAKAPKKKAPKNKKKKKAKAEDAPAIE